MIDETDSADVAQLRQALTMARGLEEKVTESLGTVRTLKRSLAARLIAKQYGSVSVDEFESLMETLCR